MQRWVLDWNSDCLKTNKYKKKKNKQKTIKQNQSGFLTTKIWIYHKTDHTACSQPHMMAAISKMQAHEGA